MSSDSMSVHSLIDRFSKTEEEESRSGIRSGRVKGSGSEPITQQQIPHKRPAQQTNTIDETGLLSLLGPSVKSFPYSEAAYIESIKLRAEQEKTKQDYYRLETANKNLNILQIALKAQIPANLIPMMCVGPGGNNESSSVAEPKPDVKSASQQHGQINRDLYQSDPANSSLVPPMSYKFGGGVSNTGRRPNSPAKIGAAAVAHLATPSNPYRTNRRNILPQHQRHFSMPASTSPSVTPNRSRSNLTKVNTNLQPSNRPPISPSNTTPSGNTSDSNIHKSPLGTTATIQVNPSPAQPLHKSTKSAQPPSQESMTSFQHIIQFHHWKPEGPGPGPLSSLGGSPTRSYKRHKSSSDNMSVDLTPNSSLNTITTTPKIRVDEHRDTDSNYDDRYNDDDDDDDDDEEEDDDDDDNENDNDITMETSTLTDINVSKIPRTESLDASKDSPTNIGRYPHNILSPSNQ